MILGNVEETESIVKYCVKDPKDLEYLLFKITGYGTYEYKAYFETRRTAFGNLTDHHHYYDGLSMR